MPRKRPSKPAVARVNLQESPLVWLARHSSKTGRPLISGTQLAAGEMLRADFTLAHLMPRVTTNYDGMPPASASGRAAPGAGVVMQDGAVAAGERVRRALVAVGPELAGVLIDVCCHLKGLEEAERLASWPQRAGKVVLQLALTRLARHYRLEPDSAPSNRVRQWGAGDYRPALDP
jgi:hypothetical protein